MKVLPFRRSLGAVLSGGGALGAWQTGALLELEEQGVAFDSVLGFSAGALNGTAHFLGRTADAYERWRIVDGGILKLSPRLWPPSLFSNAILRELAGWAQDEEECRRKGRCRLIVASALKNRERLLYSAFTPGGKEGWDGVLSDHLLASCAIPTIFPPVRLPVDGRHQWVFDGGVPCREPFDFKALGPCADIVLIELLAPGELTHRPRGLLDAVDLASRKTLRRLFDHGLASLAKGPGPAPRVFRLHPSRRLDFTMLDFRASVLRPSLEQGREDARAFLAGIREAAPR